MLVQVQAEFDEFQAQSMKRMQQRKKEIESLKEYNEKLRNELEKCVKLFQEQQLKNCKQRENYQSNTYQ